MLRRRDRDEGIELGDGGAGDERRRRTGNLSARGNRADGGAGAERRRRYRGRRRGGGSASRAQVSFVLPWRGEGLDVRRSAVAAQYHSRESAAGLRRARGDRDDGGYGVGARDSARLRVGDDRGVYQNRGASVWSRRE